MEKFPRLGKVEAKQVGVACGDMVETALVM